MNVVKQIDQWLRLAEANGYQVRHEYFGGTGGGVCEYAGKKYLFMDAGLNAVEQHDRLRTVLVEEGLLASSLPVHPNPIAVVGFRGSRKAG